MLQILLNPDDGPKYKGVAAAIARQIEDQTLVVGFRLPPVRDLAWELKITPGTVARAYRALTDKGLVQAEVGRGTFVAARSGVIDADVWSQPPAISPTGISPVSPPVSPPFSLCTEPPDSYEVTLFSPRVPDLGQLAMIQNAFRQVATLGGAQLLNYPVRAANEPVRQVVVDWLSDVPLGVITQEEVVLAHGGQSAICLCLQAILQGPSPVILVEDLSYAGFRRAAEILRAGVVGVAMDGQGIVPEALEAAIRSSGAQVLCTSPEVHNPTTLHTPLDRRVEIARICERYGVQILEDDCYRIADAKTDSYRRLLPSQTWHVASLSKSLTPGLRVGFAVAARGRSADLRRMAEYGFYGLSQPLAELTRLLLSDPQAKTVAAQIRARFSEYVRVAVNVLGAHDLQWDAEVPFVWLRLPAGWRAAAFCRAAEKGGVQIRSADEFALRDGRAPHAVRISMNAHVSLASFEAAMQRLLHLLNNPPEQGSG
jgi:DNA-binding transcriptional MocR family regulator